jgi:hypothetical protein
MVRPEAAVHRGQAQLRGSAPVADLTAQEVIAISYLPRGLRLTQVAHDIIEAILDEKLGVKVTLAKVVELFPTGLVAQVAQRSELPFPVCCWSTGCVTGMPKGGSG